jgi:hypothetical protein
MGVLSGNDKTVYILNAHEEFHCSLQNGPKMMAVELITIPHAI